MLTRSTCAASIAQASVLFAAPFLFYVLLQFWDQSREWDLKRTGTVTSGAIDSSLFAALCGDFLAIAR